MSSHRTGFHRSVAGFAAGCEGVAGLTMMFMLVVVIMVGGIAVDYASAIRTHSQLQVVADAASLAGAQRMPDLAAARTAARAIAAQNAPAQDQDAVLSDADIVFGRWDPESRDFTATDSQPNALRIVARRDASNGNPLRTILLGTLGVDWLNISAQSVATMTVVEGGETLMGRCNGGLVGRGNAETGSSNIFDQNFCIHGNLGVRTGSSNVFNDGVQVTMHDLSTLRVGSSNVGIYEAAREGVHDFGLLPQFDIMAQAMRAGDLSALPPYIYRAPVYLDRITNSMQLVPGTLYIVEGTVQTSSGSHIRDVAIVAGGDVAIGSDNTLSNMVIVTDGRLTTGASNSVGVAGFCETGVFSVYLLSRDRLRFGSSNPIRGVLAISMSDIETGSSNDGSQYLYGEAGGNVKFGSSNRFAGCPAGELRSETAIRLPTNATLSISGLVR